MKENEPVEKKRDRSRTANADFRIDGLKPVADRFGRPPSARKSHKRKCWKKEIRGATLLLLLHTTHLRSRLPVTISRKNKRKNVVPLTLPLFTRSSVPVQGRREMSICIWRYKQQVPCSPPSPSFPFFFFSFFFFPYLSPFSSYTTC